MLLKTDQHLPRFGLITLSFLLLAGLWYFLQPASDAAETCVQLEQELQTQGSYFLNWNAPRLVLVRPVIEPKMLQVEADSKGAACEGLLQLLHQ